MGVSSARDPAAVSTGGKGKGRDSLLRTRSEQQPRDKRNSQLQRQQPDDDRRTVNNNRASGAVGSMTNQQKKSAALGIKSNKQVAAPTSSFASPTQSKFLQDKGKNVFENDRKAVGKLSKDNSLKQLTPSAPSVGVVGTSSGIPRAVKRSPASGGSAGGFQKLMNQKQPVIISYDDDIQGGIVGVSASKRQQQQHSAYGSSSQGQLHGSYTGKYSESELPLAGQSEYVRWGI